MKIEKENQILIKEIIADLRKLELSDAEILDVLQDLSLLDDVDDIDHLL